ncbi:hypothetical protein [Desertivirga xinjiangensis]|uniref:hypothetical protein n=1 Tax=Desertivirga xinjiangensis TaxID=539206 RepID=UPI00210CE9A1|nr:hypothetical protein [Pedobacter xinjiangensis]
MSVQEILGSRIINLSELSKRLWPDIKEVSAVIKLKNKIAGTQGQRLTEKDLELIDRVLLEQAAGLTLPNLLEKFGFKMILGVYEFKHGTTHLALELDDEKYYLFDGRPEVQHNYQEGDINDLNINSLAKMLANYGRNLLRSY